MKTWRDSARSKIIPILEQARKENWTEARIKKALFDAYPYGERRCYPYKVWLDEIKVQRGLKKGKLTKHKDLAGQTTFLSE